MLFQPGLAVGREAFYVLRESDDRLFDRLSRLETSAVLAPRQVGKSSLCQRVADRLEAKGIRVVSIGDASVGVASVAREEQEVKWYFGLANRIADDLNLTAELSVLWSANEGLAPAARFRAFLLKCVCVDGSRTVIFLDEIDRVRSLEVRFDAFFDLLRDIANERAADPRWQRIAFCVAGVATLDELSLDRTRVAAAIPGMLVRLDDFTRAQLDDFAPGFERLPGGAARWLDAIFSWTHGHPSLTQTLGHSLTEEPPLSDNAPVVVGERVERLFLREGRTDHPIFVDTDRRFGGLAQTASTAQMPRILSLYRQLLCNGEVVADENDPNQLALRIGGLISLRKGRLEVRNKVFGTLFDTKWVRQRIGSRPYIEQVLQWAQTHDHNLLPKSRDLDEALAWAAEREDLLHEERAFMDAARLRRVQVRWLQGGLLFGMVIASLFALGLLRLYRRATVAERLADQRALEARQQSDAAFMSSVSSRASELRLRADSPGSEYDDLADSLLLYQEARQRLVAQVESSAALFQNLEMSLASLPLEGHVDHVNSAAFSTDGRRIVTTSSDHTARVWNALNGRLIAILQGHTDQVTGAAFSSDGTRIVTSSWDHTARVWNASNGRLIAALPGHTDRVASAAFSPDGTRIVTASWDDSARVWNALDGRPIVSLRGHAESVNSATFSDDGRRIVTASSDGSARVWDASDGRLIVSLQGHTESVNSAAFSADGTRIVTASSDRTARVWDASDGRLVASCQGQLDGHTDSVNSAVFSPDGARVVTASSDRTARVWDASDGQLRTIFRGHTENVNSAVFSPDGTRVVTASSDRTARVWDASDGRLIATLPGHTDRVTGAAFSADGTCIVTTSWDRTARVWNALDGRLITTFQGHTDHVNSAVFSADGTLVVTASSDRSAGIWSALDGGAFPSLEGHTDGVTSAAFSANSTLIVTSSWDRTARVWEASDGSLVATLRGHTDHVNSAAFSADGTRIVTASRDRTARIWNASNGRLIVSLQGHVENVNSAAFSADGTRIVTASWDRTARIWNTSDGRLTISLEGHTENVNSAAYSTDGTRIVTGSSDRTARIWNASDGRLIVSLQGHTESVNSATYSTDGTRIVTGSSDRTARIWNALDGRLIAILRGHTDRVNSAAFSTDGARIITASDDRTARVWRMDPSETVPLACTLLRDKLPWTVNTPRATLLHTICAGVPESSPTSN